MESLHTTDASEVDITDFSEAPYSEQINFGLESQFWDNSPRHKVLAEETVKQKMRR